VCCFFPTHFWAGSFYPGKRTKATEDAEGTERTFQNRAKRDCVFNLSFSSRTNDGKKLVWLEAGAAYQGAVHVRFVQQ
jgi:hypothetical protein